MPSMTLDVAYEEFEDFPRIMGNLEKDYGVKVSVVTWVGSGGGWPEIKFEGPKENLERLYNDKFDGGDPFEDIDFED